MTHFVIVLMYLFPAFAFLLAEVLELRSGMDRTLKLWRLLPGALGLVAYAFIFSTFWIPVPGVSSSKLAEGAAILFFAMIGCSGFYVAYVSRLASILMAVGALTVVFLYLLSNLIGTNSLRISQPI